MHQREQIDIIEKTRGRVLNDHTLTGEDMFLIWGYATALFLLLEFAALEIWGSTWCMYIWIGIPLVGAPLMFISYLRDNSHAHHIEVNAFVIMKMWIYLGFVIGALGFALGFAGLYTQCFFPLLCLLCSLGGFITGLVAAFRPMTICGLVASGLALATLAFQGTLWHWQLPSGALTIAVALIIPGHLFRRFVKNNDI